MSFTIGSLIAVVLATLAKSAGLDTPVEAADVETSFATLVQLGAFILAWYGRYRQGDVKWYGRKIS